MKRISASVSRLHPLPSEAVARPVHSHSRNTSSEWITHVQRLLHSVLTIVLATLREIFDESAYARFLDRNQLAPSRQAYASFLRENARRNERRARCC